LPQYSEGTNPAVDKLNRTFEVSATLSNLKTTKTKRPHATEKWFDNDCKRLQNPNQKHNENIRHHLDHEKLNIGIL